MEVLEFILMPNGHRDKERILNVPPKIILIGVGNSGTKLMGILINQLLQNQGYPLYYYEPLYWSGSEGENNLCLSVEGVEEHKSFPLLPEDSVSKWPWLDDFLYNLEGLAKFIRLGSRVRLLSGHTVKIIWITRELYSYLASMQKNFPRSLPNAGWHHRPGEYDDYERLKEIYSNFDLRFEEKYRIEVEAAWWHLHNSQVLRYQEEMDICHVGYEDLCSDPLKWMKKVAEFIEMPFSMVKGIKEVHSVPDRTASLSPRNIAITECIAGALNRQLYPLHYHIP